MLLVNGASGIAVGFATDIPSFDPMMLVKEIKKFLDGGDFSDSYIPYYRGYTGNIVPYGKTWQTSGIINKVKDKVYEIVELSLGGKYSKTQAYKEFLLHWKKSKKFVKKINEYHTINSVKFEILTDGKEDEEEFDIKKLKLVSKFEI